jgi:hypothetical protein
MQQYFRGEEDQPIFSANLTPLLPNQSFLREALHIVFRQRVYKGTNCGLYNFYIITSHRLFLSFYTYNVLKALRSDVRAGNED